MDPRIEAHADVLVDYCTDVSEGDQVAVLGPPIAEDLVAAVFERVGARGANPVWLSSNGRLRRARMLDADPESFSLAEHMKALVEESDVAISIRATENASATSDVSPEKNAEVARVQQPIMEAAQGKNWVATQHPTPAGAQLAGMSTEAYAEFVWDAVGKDWDAQRDHQEQLVELLDPAEEVRIVSGDDTDLTMSVAGMNACNDAGKDNMPGGEVFTAPVPDSVEGTVLFDVPCYRQGREIHDAFLRFEDGEVVEFSASQNEDVLAAILDTDDGARRLGELGIGMNRDIDRFSYNMLFDEKMGDTVHMALGFAIQECLPEGVEGNESATHVDMIVDMSEDSHMSFDGEVVQRNGTFVFEDGFEG